MSWAATWPAEGSHTKKLLQPLGELGTMDTNHDLAGGLVRQHVEAADV